MQKLTLDTCQVLDDRPQEGIVIRTAKSASLTYINFDINLEYSSPLIYIGIIRRSLYPSSTTDPTKIYIKLSTEKGDRYAKYVSESRRLKSKEAEYKASLQDTRSVSLWVRCPSNMSFDGIDVSQIFSRQQKFG